MSSFQNKVVWITGASSGYGEAMARALSACGARLILSARRADRLQVLADELKNAVVLPLDLEQPDTFRTKTKEAIAAFGHIDIQMHNGALAQSGSALETTADVSRRIMQVDYFSYTELARCLLPHFIEKQQGHIVVISGLLAKITLPGRSSYAAAKAALHGYFGCLRAELLSSHIDVTILVPGAMQTELVSKALQADGSATNKPAPLTGCPLTLPCSSHFKRFQNANMKLILACGMKTLSFTA